MNVRYGSATVTLTAMNGCIYVADLESHGLKDLLRIARLIRTAKRSRPTFLMVDEDNPRKEELMKAYEKRLGAQRRWNFMEVL